MTDAQRSDRPGLVSFVGAGPGDPELITVKGRKAIAEAALVLYTGSLLPPEVVACAAPGAIVRDSAPLTLAQCHALLRETALAGKPVARVHTGDPSLYGCLQEQIRLLDADGIPWRVIPGVTAACAVAAAAGLSLTMPEACQSLIITRMAGATPVPSGERLRDLAVHGATLAVYLSAARAEEMQHELLQSLPADTVILCGQRIGWPDEKLVSTRLDALAQCVRQHNLDRQTVFLILPGQRSGATPVSSRLYDARFSHGFRTAQSPALQMSPREKQPTEAAPKLHQNTGDSHEQT
ncbi:MAG: precorrin-4 C(11)-methyltransferase [Desulfovibrio sp.]|nr:precorrin-4 C(11)-methyltransferase [Desulfovibrio sp.]